jgi:hypothetical protein
VGEGVKGLKLWGDGDLGAWQAAGGRLDLEMRQWTAPGRRGRRVGHRLWVVRGWLAVKQAEEGFEVDFGRMTDRSCMRGSRPRIHDGNHF